MQNTSGNATGAGYWQKEVTALMDAMDEPFFNRQDGMPNVMRESACESPAPFTRAPTCNIDQRSFKAYLSRFMAYTWQLCPWTRDWIMVRLRASAQAAAKSCTGDPGGDTCGLSWIMGHFDGSSYGVVIGGVGEHLAAMELFQSLLIPGAPLPRTHVTGTSKGNPSAGGSSGLTADDLRQTGPTTAGDKAGAGILTALFLGGLCVLTWWLITD